MAEANFPVLEMYDVSAVAGSAQLLSNVSFSVSAGEFVSVIGRNGAGKSSLLKACFRGIAISKGDIRLLGSSTKQLSQSEIARMIAYVPQGLDVTAPLSVAEFVRISCYPYFGNTRKRLSDQMISAALDRLNMSEYISRALNSLSGGERQRVLLSAALVGKPAIVMLDEPTTYLDPAAQAELFSTLTTLRSEINCAVVMVSHHLTAAKRYSDRIIALLQGRIAANGSPAEVLSAEVLNSVYGCLFDDLSPVL